MPFTIEDTEVERLATQLAKATGETISVATRRALEDRIRKVSSDRERLLGDLAEIRHRWSGMDVRDSRTADEIVAYDDRGLPG